MAKGYALTSILSRRERREDSTPSPLRERAGVRGLVQCMRVNFIVRLVFATVVLFASLSVSSAQSAAPAAVERPSSWAVPLEKPGLPNLFKVTDSLYRGAQPTAAGFAELTNMGIRTVVNLRARHSDAEEIGTLSLRRIEIPTDTWDLDEASAVRFLQTVTKTNGAPFFVHCQHGADRTGTMCAVYRVVIQGWTKEEAIREMTEGGYGFHKVWENLVDFIQA